MQRAYAAVDLGAGSGRVVLGRFHDDGLELGILHRFHYGPRVSAGHERWDFEALWRGVCAGLRAASGAPPRSIGVDGWGVDYGLLDEDGELLEDPVSYRDGRTAGILDALLQRAPRNDIYARTGIQFMPINTSVQLCAQMQSKEWPQEARRLLMIPDLVHNRLCDSESGEETNASTTQLLNAGTRRWDPQLLEAVGVPADVMPPLVSPGTDLGALDPLLQRRLGLPDVRVIAPATHDTASAVIGTPLEDGWAYISSGTWSMVGLELPAPVLTAEALAANFTNEAGAFRTTRFLKNVMGLWILEGCRKAWEQRGVRLPHDEISARLAGAPPGALFIDPDDPRFLNPPDMLEAVLGYFRETCQKPVEDPLEVAKAILESLARRYAEVVRKLEALTGRTIQGIHIVGGGSQNDFLNQATADACGLPVRAGPVEAAAIGNLLVQAVADGALPDPASARSFVARAFQLRSFRPCAGMRC
ncbi:MAG: rhamnulokinase [Planctomycetota bacterium]|nr:MAG: rhamnulokinase [Planctomycetota bacterium]